MHSFLKKRIDEGETAITTHSHKERMKLLPVVGFLSVDHSKIDFGKKKHSI